MISEDKNKKSENNTGSHEFVPLFRLMITGILASLVILLGLLLFANPVKKIAEKEAAAEEVSDEPQGLISVPQRSGISYLSESDSMSADAVQEQINNISEARKTARREETLRKIEDGELDCWSLYEDGLLLGDSRMGEFAWCGFLDENLVCAEKSNTIRNIPDYYEHIQYMNPSFIVLNYGMNDIGCGEWDDVYEWCDEFEGYVKEIQELVPSAKLYVLAVFPVIDPAFERCELWYDIPEWNLEVKAKCEELGIEYFDLSYLAEEYADDYQEDGIHFYVPFYYAWGEEMITYIDY